eukprot:3858325-Pyramimonas_sp.AAC.1
MAKSCALLVPMATDPNEATTVLNAPPCVVDAYNTACFTSCVVSPQFWIRMPCTVYSEPIRHRDPWYVQAC